MIKLLARRALRSFSQRYDYDTGYLEELLQHDPAAFLKFSLVNIPAAHRRTVPPTPFWAARIRAALWEDCGPCVQLVCNMALEAGVDAEVVSAVAASDIEALDDKTALAVRFTEAVLAHDTEADTLRDEVIQHWGQGGLVSLALAISLTRVYPSLKYTLGHGKSCSRLRIAQRTIAPAAFGSTTMPVGSPGGLTR
jgi:hypothetical protein